MAVANTTFVELDSIAAPANPGAGKARIYYDSADSKLKYGQSGAYVVFDTSGGWTDDGTVVRLTTVTDQVAMGSATATAGRRLTVVEPSGSTLEGVRVEAEVAGSNVLDVIVTADANARYQVKGDGSVSWGPGNAVADNVLDRLSASAMRFSKGLRVGGAIDRLEAALTVGPTRTAAGVGDAVTVAASAAVAATNSANAGAAATLQGSAAAADGAFQAAGGDAVVVAGAGASGVGGAAAAGGKGILRAGNGSTNNGSGGDCSIESGAKNGTGADGVVTFLVSGQVRTPDVVPRADSEGNLGTAARRWSLIRGVTVTSGAYFEEEVFDFERGRRPKSPAQLKAMLRAELAPGSWEVQGSPVRHLARIGLLAAHILASE